MSIPDTYISIRESESKSEPVEKLCKVQESISESESESHTGSGNKPLERNITTWWTRCNEEVLGSFYTERTVVCDVTFAFAHLNCCRFTRRRYTRMSMRRSPERMRRRRRRPTRRRCSRVSSAPRSSNGSLPSKNISGTILQACIKRHHFEK